MTEGKTENIDIHQGGTVYRAGYTYLTPLSTTGRLQLRRWITS